MILEVSATDNLIDIYAILPSQGQSTASSIRGGRGEAEGEGEGSQSTVVGHTVHLRIDGFYPYFYVAAPLTFTDHNCEGNICPTPS
jgi:hypothetical protein